MSHKDIFEYFKLYFPLYSGDNIEAWFQNGKNSIRVRQTIGQELIFTFNNHKNWKLETIDSFIKNILKGGIK